MRAIVKHAAVDLAAPQKHVICKVAIINPHTVVSFTDHNFAEHGRSCGAKLPSMHILPLRAFRQRQSIRALVIVPAIAVIDRALLLESLAQVRTTVYNGQCAIARKLFRILCLRSNARRIRRRSKCQRTCRNNGCHHAQRKRRTDDSLH